MAGHVDIDAPASWIRVFENIKAGNLRRFEVSKVAPVFREIPVIIFPTTLNSWSREQCLKLDAHSYLVKSDS